MSNTIELVRDVLDKKLIDDEKCEIGRADSIVIEMPQGRQPRMVRIEMGGEILAARVARWLVPPTRWLRQHFGPRRATRVKLEWKHVKRMGRDLHLDIRADQTDALAWEHWLSEKWVSRVPGADK